LFLLDGEVGVIVPQKDRLRPRDFEKMPAIKKAAAAAFS
jgi:hypothetical protein